MSWEQWREVMSTNLDSMFSMTRPVIDGMRERGHGRIINISLINGQMGQTNYSAAKAGVIGFTKALAQENARKGITVNAICPGYINTDMVAAMPEKVLESIVSTIPVGRLGHPEEIGELATYLASDAAAFMTGSVPDDQRCAVHRQRLAEIRAKPNNRPPLTWGNTTLQASTIARSTMIAAIIGNMVRSMPPERSGMLDCTESQGIGRDRTPQKEGRREPPPPNQPHRSPLKFRHQNEQNEGRCGFHEIALSANGAAKPRILPITKRHLAANAMLDNARGQDQKQHRKLHNQPGGNRKRHRSSLCRPVSFAFFRASGLSRLSFPMRHQIGRTSRPWRRIR